MILYEEPLKIEFKGMELFVNGHKHEHSIRKLQQMRDVLLYNVEPRDESDFNIYYMYRSVFSSIDMRFDVTLIPARMLGNEFNKTYGHYHPVAEQTPDGPLSYPEVYQVLSGSAFFVLQKKNRDGTLNVLAIEAKERECVVIPPNYGHVTINSSAERNLVLSNVVFNGFESDYEDYTTNHGAAYYFTSEGFVQNTNYLVRAFDRTSAGQLNEKYGFTCRDLLREFKDNPDRFRFLEKPSLLFR